MITRNADRLVIAYVIILFLTFGFIASNTDCRQSFLSATSVTECKAGKAIFGSIFWPFYWIWTAFDAGRAALAHEGAK